MAAAKRKSGCALVAAVILLLGAALLYNYFIRPRWERRLPPPSGGELQVHVLNIGQGDSILIISPTGKTALVDAGETGDGTIVLDALKRYGATGVDLFIATHAHADHIGAADEVIRAAPRIGTVVDSGVPPPARASTDGTTSSSSERAEASGGSRRTTRRRSGVQLPTTKSYEDFLRAVEEKNAQYVKAEPGQSFDLGGGAVIAVLAPSEPLFTKEQLRSGGNEPNANSVVTRLDYGDFSMLLTGDAEEQTEERLISRGANLSAKLLKVGHHGSKYATSENLLKRMRPEAAIISNGESNRYGHPSQEVLDRLRNAGVKVYRTDLQGEISIRSRGTGYKITTAKEASGNVWAGREPQRDDSSRTGFISYGDFGPSPSSSRQPSEKSARSAAGNR